MTDSAVKTLRLKSGEVITSTQPAIIDTLITSSSVGVCVFSVDKSIGGMVQFEQSTSGETLIKSLVQNLQKLSGQSPNLFSAKIVGGSKNKKAPQTADQNIKIAKKILADYKIKIIGEDVGGSNDRQALFHTNTGRLQVASVQPESGQNDSNDDRKRKVLIVDDSKTIRDLLVRILSEDPHLEIIGTAVNPIEAEKLLKTLKPDVITLDIHMPEMTGVEWLEKLLPRMSIPVVMITSLQLQDGGEVFKALELGAVDYIQKPVLNEIKEMAPVIREKVKSASFAKVKRRGRATSVAISEIPIGTMDQNLLIAIGASTGGTEALKDVLLKLPKDIPPIVIVQHIPAVFSKAFADRLNTICAFEVLEAKDGDEVRAGRVLIAAGGTQMAIEKSRNGYIVRVTDDEPMNRHKPSVDFLFNSVAKVAGAKSVGVILTGMGADGAQGLLKMKQVGARTLGQDEESCVVYGMPRAAFQVGAVDEVHSLDEMPMAIAKKGHKKKSVA